MSGRGLVQVVLVQEHDGEARSEFPWARPLGEDRYQLRNIPFVRYGISLDDVFEALPVPGDPRPRLTRVIKKSGNRTLWILLSEPVDASPDSLALVASLRDIGCSLDGDGKRAFAVNVPPQCDLGQVCRFLTECGVEWESADPLDNA